MIEYVDLLNRVLEDRRATTGEAEELLDAANRWGLSQEDVQRVHRGYLEALASAAVLDGLVSDAERRDLNQVAELLGYDSSVIDAAIQAAHAIEPDAPAAGTERSVRAREALAGLTVCFTGESRCAIDGAALSRERARQLATAAGLVVKDSITKTLDILVVADPNSQSGKARKAREHNVRIMAETVFWQALGFDVR